ncbi:molecular chaperone Hsp33 [Planomicrobium koreense]|uniref:33 kDa chaperonin n=1 Tax=Planococcus koreensis TaxID=112331 RepID=A0A7W8CUL8_9BACL|nr:MULTISPECIES: Hsp33 family molecular chaperone HslO [Planococcus]MBB5181890.1 molecular chaperone Hsp33 [Planococcus koreensis]MDN3451141.1 Hsp33 family molecular chaperone HslO [Planococcus sp. APC 3906]
MGDYLVRGLGFNGSVRAFAADATETVGEAQRRHQTWPTASAALGRAMTAGVMLGAMLKGDDKVTLKIQGGGPIGAILVDSDADGKVRGYVTNPQTQIDSSVKGKLDVKGAVGTNGMLAIVKDLGMKENFTGQTPIVSGEIAEDLTYYFAVSEQVPSSVGLGVLVDTDNSILAAGGFIIQLMPDTDDETITAIEKRLAHIEPVSTMIQRGLTPEGILEEVLGEGNVQILDKMPVKFECNCSKERFAEGILGLGEKEIREMIEEQGMAETQCHFCLEKYHYSKEELEALIDELHA